MTQKINFFFHVTSLFSALVGLLAFYSDATLLRDVASIIIFISYPALLLTRKNAGILFILFHSGLFFSAYIPVFSLFISGEGQYSIVLFITVFLFLVAPKSYLYNDFKIKNLKQSKTIFYLWAVFIFLAAVFAVTSPIGPYSAAAFYGFFGISLFALEYQLRSKLKRFQAAVLILTQSVLVAIFIHFMWTGGGRILMGAIIMMFAGIIHHYGYLRIRFVYILVFGPALIFLGHVLRYGVDTPFELHSGSVGRPVINAHDFLTTEGSLSKAGFDGFFDQLLLFFFNWFPRDAWESKPLGLGYTMVDDYFGRIGVSEDHSTAPGFIGEALWFFGSNFWFGAVLSLATFLLTMKFLNRLSKGWVTPVVIFASFTANYLWGGLASVGARVWFFLLPALLFMLFVEYVRTHNMRRRSHEIRH